MSSVLHRYGTLLVLALAGSCHAVPEPVAESVRLLTDAATPWRTCGQSVEGRPIEYAVFGSGEETVMLIASIHGNEEAGTPLLLRLADLLADPHEAPAWMDDRRVVLVPRVNPDGLAAGRRHNAHGVDLNRNFPSTNFRAGRGHGPAPLSEPESRAIQALVQEYTPDRVITFHMPIALIDYDGPAEGLARAMGAVSPLRVRRIGSRPGSLGSWIGEDLGLPIVTVELPPSARRLAGLEAWEFYGPMIETAIGYEE